VKSQLVVELGLEQQSEADVAGAPQRFDAALRAALARLGLSAERIWCGASQRRLAAELELRCELDGATTALAIQTLLTEVPSLAHGAYRRSKTQGWSRPKPAAVIQVNSAMACLDGKPCTVRWGETATLSSALGVKGGSRIEWLPGTYRDVLSSYGIVLDVDERRSRFFEALLREHAREPDGLESQLLEELTVRFEQPTLRRVKLPTTRPLPVSLLRDHLRRCGALLYLPADTKEHANAEIQALLPAELCDTQAQLAASVLELQRRYVEETQLADMGKPPGDAETAERLRQEAERCAALCNAIAAELSLSSEVLSLALVGTRPVQLLAASGLARDYPAVLPDLWQVLLGAGHLDASSRALLELYYSHCVPLAAAAHVAIPLSAVSRELVSSAAALLFLANSLGTVATAAARSVLPVGPHDPLGARVAGVGVIRVLLEQQWELGLALLARLGCAVVCEPGTGAEAVEARSLGFLRQRMRTLLPEKPEAQAAGYAGIDDVPVLRARQLSS
jgi:hypothetical protein